MWDITEALTGVLRAYEPTWRNLPMAAPLTGVVPVVPTIYHNETVELGATRPASWTT